MSPEKNSMSVPQTPARSTSTTTSPAPAAGGATSTTSALPGPVITNARMSGRYRGFTRSGLPRPPAGYLPLVLLIKVPDLPFPGHGQTWERLRGLAALGRDDLVTARLGEGHADAMAIRAELGDSSPKDGERWG